MSTVIDIAKLVFDAEDNATKKIEKMNKTLAKNEQQIEDNYRQNEKWSRGLVNNTKSISQYEQKLELQNKQLVLLKQNVDRVTASELSSAKAINNAKAAVLAKEQAIINSEIALEKLNQSQTEYNAKIVKNIQANDKLTASNKELDTTYVGLVGEVLQLAKSQSGLYNSYVKQGSVLDKIVRKTGEYGETLNENIQKMRKEDAEFKSKYSTINKAVSSYNKLNAASKKYSTVIDASTKVLTKEDSALRKVISTRNKEEGALTSTAKSLKQYVSQKKQATTQDGKSAKALNKEEAEMKGLKNATSKATTELKSFNKVNQTAGKTAGNFSIGNIGLAAGVITGTAVAVQQLTLESMKYLQVQDNVDRAVRDSFENQELYNEASNELTQTLGINRTQFAQSTIQIANQAKIYGLATEEAENYAVAGTALAGVLANTNLKGYDFAETSQRLITALRGEAEAAEELGLALGATQMDEFTEKIKEQGVAIEGTFNAQDADVQMKLRLASAVEQVSIQTGINIDEMNNMGDVYSNVQKILVGFNDNLTVTQKVLIAFKVEMANLYQNIRPLATLLALLGGVILVGLARIITIVSGGIEALAFAFQTTLDVTSPASQSFMQIGQLLAAIGTLLTTLVNGAFTIFGQILAFIVPLLETISPILTVLVNILNYLAEILINGAVAGIRALAEAFISLIQPMYDAISNSTVLAYIQNVWKNILELLSPLIYVVAQAVQLFVTFITQLTNSMQGTTETTGRFGTVITLVGQIVQLVKDVFEQFANLLSTSVAVALDGLMAIINTLVDIFRTFAPVLALVVKLFLLLAQNVLSALVPILEVIVAGFQRLGSVVLQYVFPAIQQIATIIAAALVPILEALIQHVLPLIETLGKLAEVLIGTVVEAIAAVLSNLQPLIDAFQNVLQNILPPLIETFSMLAEGIRVVIETAIIPLVQAIKANLEPVIQLLITVLGILIEVVGQVVAVFLEVVQFIASFLIPIIEVLMSVLSALISSFLNVVGAVLSAVIPVLEKLWDIFGQVIDVVIQLAEQIISFLQPILMGLGEVLSVLIGWVSKLYTWLYDKLGPAFELIGEIASSVWDVFEAGIGVIQRIVDWVQRLVDKFKSLADALNPFDNIADKWNEWRGNSAEVQVDVMYNEIGKPVLDNLQVGRNFNKSFLGTNVYGSNGKVEYNYNVHTTQQMTPASIKREQAVWDIQKL